MNVTVPVAVPDPGSCTVTVAVNVTGCPTFDGFVEDVSAVDVSAFCTSWSSGGRRARVEARIAAVDRRDVVMADRQRRGREGRDAAPLRVPVPSVAAPSMNVTVPVAVPAPGATMVTVAVNVTDCPNSRRVRRGGERRGRVGLLDFLVHAWSTCSR